MIRIALSCLALVGTLSAQVPHLIDYQGKISVNGTNFNGAGEFKFALINAAGDTTYWSNDGTDGVPSVPVVLAVTDGLYSVLLGEAPMEPLAPSVFDQPEVRLRVWFNDTVNGFQLLAPDRRIAAVGYALMAESVPDGSITGAKLAPGLAASLGGGNLAASLSPSDAALLGEGFIRIQSVPTPPWQDFSAVGAPNPRTHHTAVWTGTGLMVWGGKIGTVLSNQGGRYLPESQAWSPLPTSGVSAARSHHTAVWTGDRMIVWGGFTSSGESNSGALYAPPVPGSDPPIGGWLATSPVSAPEARSGHTAVWTETEMIVWGGKNAGGALGNGGRFTPPSGPLVPGTEGTWGALAVSAPRHGHTTVWTGSRMLVWGGLGADFQPLATGASYDPVANTWTDLPTLGAPTPRTGHSAVWTGSRMIVFGGASAELAGPSDVLADGAAYDPVTGVWTPFSNTGAPSARHSHGAVWTGSEMLVYGGGEATAAAYHPTSDTWRALPSGDFGGVGVWSGSALLVFGGSGLHTLDPSPAFHLYGKF